MGVWAAQCCLCLKTPGAPGRRGLGAGLLGQGGVSSPRSRPHAPPCGSRILGPGAEAAAGAPGQVRRWSRW